MLLRHFTVHKQDYRPACAGVGGMERTVAVAGGDTLFNRPCNRLLEGCCNACRILEDACVSRGFTVACGTPKEGYDLSSGAGVAGNEVCCILAAGNLRGSW